VSVLSVGTDSPYNCKETAVPCLNVIEYLVLQGKGLLPLKTVLVTIVANVHSYSLLTSSALFMFTALPVFFFLTNPEHTIQMVQLFRLLLTSRATARCYTFEVNNKNIVVQCESQIR
jgi:hypothetical protein